MYWFILIFPFLIYPWGPDPYYTQPKVAYLYVFVLGYWLFVILKRKYGSFEFTNKTISMEFIVGLFFLLIIFSSVFSVNIDTALYGTSGRYEGALTLFCYISIFLFSYRFSNVNKLLSTFRGMLFASGFLSIYGILQHFFIDFLPRSSTKLNEIRSYSFFDNPNFYGSYLVLTIFISVIVFLHNENKKYTLFHFITICLSFIALIFSGTRSGWLGVLFGVLFLTVFVVWKRKYLWKKWIILLATWFFIFAMIDIVENGTYFARFASLISDSYKVTSGNASGGEGSSRLIIWKNTVPLLKEYYLFGSGPDTFEYVFPQDTEEKKKYFGHLIVDKAHNEYLQIAVTLGIPALVIYLYLLYLVLKTAFRAVNIAQGNNQIILYGLISAISGYLVQAFFNISVVPVAPIFWFILGITMSFSTHLLNSVQKS
ncbi:O-antigen ligase family protein [Bacillus marasmi]|uniref:O-antigen ligase family protein n=1 Tax=Bacillus marasmi TaxID=1926279 RepID=UPI0011CB90B5|nr:O-antigen ligase family protein [Bacillus marasmi]